ncbi:MAG: hypothetical protein ACK55I_02810 [bacterium]
MARLEPVLAAFLLTRRPLPGRLLAFVLRLLSLCRYCPARPHSIYVPQFSS